MHLGSGPWYSACRNAVADTKPTPVPWKHKRRLDDPITGLKPHNWQWAITQRRLEKETGLYRQWKTGEFSYTDDQNYVQLTGQITRAPSIESGKARRCWFRLRVRNKLVHGQQLAMPVRCQGDLAEMVFANCAMGDRVAVVGQMWTGAIAGRNFTFLFADRIGFGVPVVVQKDRRFVRVRADTWNALLQKAGVTHLSKAYIPKNLDQPIANDAPDPEWVAAFSEAMTEDNEPHPKPTTETET